MRQAAFSTISWQSKPFASVSDRHHFRICSAVFLSLPKVVRNLWKRKPKRVTSLLQSRSATWDNHDFGWYQDNFLCWHEHFVSRISAVLPCDSFSCWNSFSCFTLDDLVSHAEFDSKECKFWNHDFDLYSHSRTIGTYLSNDRYGFFETISFVGCNIRWGPHIFIQSPPIAHF